MHGPGSGIFAILSASTQFGVGSGFLDVEQGWLISGRKVKALSRGPARVVISKLIAKSVNVSLSMSLKRCEVVVPYRESHSAALLSFSRRRSVSNQGLSLRRIGRMCEKAIRSSMSFSMDSNWWPPDELTCVS